MHSHLCSRSRFPLARRRGSVLIVALIFALVIAISLGSFLQLANGATKISYRTHYLGVAMNTAETGLEQAMWEINNSAATWSGWTSPGTAGAHRTTFDLGKVEGGATATVKVYAQEKVGTAPAWIVARAIVTPTTGSPIEKWVKVTLQKRSRGGVGGLGRDGITSSGNQVVMGSWNSDPDKDPSTPPLPFSAALLNDAMPLATTSIDATLSSGNADINGTAAVGSDTTDAIQVGAQGYIGPFNTPAGTKDPNSVSANFSADIPIEEAPTDKTYTDLGTVSTATTLPRGGDTPNADGIYYYEATQINLNGSALAISAGAQVVINIPTVAGTAISLAGNGGAIQVNSTLVTDTVTGAQDYTSGKLKLYTPGNISLSGQAAVVNVVTTQNYTASASTTDTTVSNVQPIYGKGQQKTTVIGWSYTQASTTATTIGSTTTTTSSSNTYQTLIEAGGTEPVAGTSSSSSAAGVTTDTGSYVGQADNLRIYGTRTEEDMETYNAQSITISGNGSLSAVVYAPNADIEAKGGGNSGFVYGSLIGKSLKFTGNDCFYYDESLGNSDDGARLGIEDWDEMVSYADRNTYASYMNF
ncbi:MAG: hypothetical protein K0R17_3001 [Rariglobus sp.]|jgi:Tfp pilus assembly protein PilX|nr:hypothetical protein [Rariglobus sp.]